MAFTAEPPVPANPRSPTEAGHQPALSRSARSAGAQTAVTAGHADSAVPANRPDDVPASPGTTDCVCAAGPSPIAGCATDPSTTATRVRDTGGTCCAAAVRSRNAAAVRGASHSGVTVGAAELAERAARRPDRCRSVRRPSPFRQPGRHRQTRRHREIARCPSPQCDLGRVR